MISDIRYPDINSELISRDIRDIIHVISRISAAEDSNQILMNRYYYRYNTGRTGTVGTNSTFFSNFFFYIIWKQILIKKENLVSFTFAGQVDHGRLKQCFCSRTYSESTHSSTAADRQNTSTLPPLV